MENSTLYESNAFTDAYKSVKKFIYAKKDTAKSQKEYDETKKKYDEMKKKQANVQKSKPAEKKTIGDYETLDDVKREIERRKAEAKPYDDQYRRLINKAHKTINDLKKESVTLYEAMSTIDNYLTEKPYIHPRDKDDLKFMAKTGAGAVAFGAGTVGFAKSIKDLSKTIKRLEKELSEEESKKNPDKDRIKELKAALKDRKSLRRFYAVGAGAGALGAGLLAANFQAAHDDYNSKIRTRESWN